MQNGYVLYQSGEDVRLEIYLKNPSQQALDCLRCGKAISFDSPKDVPDSGELKFMNIEDGEISYDESKVRKEALDILRYRRNEALEELDKACLRYITNQERLHNIEKYKQQLRDLPETVDFTSVKVPVDIGHVDPPALTMYKEVL
jgi:hypothetical protein